MKLVFATNNQNKVNEIQRIVPPEISMLSLKDINCSEEIPETQNTIEGNAAQKSRYVFEHYQVNCFADDTGLEIEALNGEPGVLSARYAGEAKSSEDNMNKVLTALKGNSNRKARFKTVISLIIDGKEIQFEGIVDGVITESKSGVDGFGYDPIFMPDGYAITFAEMSMEDKNKISHRALAVNKLVEYLNKVYLLK